MDIKPHFYDEFRCIADKCHMTCCMQWKIAVDEKTLSRWKKTFLNGKRLDIPVKKCGREGIIRLNKNGDCPYLKEGLCSLVSNFGEDILSETCHTFPRQIHEFPDRRELSVVSCCPAVIDFLHTDSKLVFQNLDAVHGDINFSIRNLMMEIVGNKNYDVNSALLMAFYILLDIEKKDTLSPEDISEYQKESTLASLYQAIKALTPDKAQCLKENNELWLDIVYNYRKEGLYTKYIEDISLLAEEILDKGTDMPLEAFHKEFAEYENLFRNYLVSELFTNILIPESDRESMVVMFQWICMEYAVIRQGVFLKWLLNAGKTISQPLTYETVRDYIVVIARMTGYDEEDIYEYMENSFQDVIWEWSYLFLILSGFFPG